MTGCKTGQHLQRVSHSVIILHYSQELSLSLDVLVSTTNFNIFPIWIKNETSKLKLRNSSSTLSVNAHDTLFFVGKSITDQDIKQLLRILVKALESFNDIVLLEALVVCLTRLQPLLRPVSKQHIIYIAMKLLKN